MYISLGWGFGFVSSLSDMCCARAMANAQRGVHNCSLAEVQSPTPCHPEGPRYRALGLFPLISSIGAKNLVGNPVMPKVNGIKVTAL